MKMPAWWRMRTVGLLGMSVAAMVVAVPPEDARDAGAERLLAGPSTPARPGHDRKQSKQSAQPEGRVELERWNRQAGAAPASKAGAADAAGDDGKKAPDAPAPKADVVNAFSATSWYVPPPPPKPEPPPKPTAPPVPFTFMGRYEDATRSSVVVMLIKGDRLYTVSTGDVIEDTYRVDKITDKTIELIYLPLHTKQSLPTGGA
jgi:hypothetical protein